MSRERIQAVSEGDIVPCTWSGGGGSGHCQLELLALLREGAFSRTYRCEDIARKEEYLVKRVELSGLSDGDFQSRLREVDIWTKLRHPNILRCHFGWQRGDCELWILSETALHSVEQLVLTKARAPPQALYEKWLYQLASALKYLHEDQPRPILHRNMKPSNIMVTDNYVLKLSDFGFSKELRSKDDMTGSRVGTGRTMSPEMVNNQPYDAKTDMWSMGICMVYIATQQHAVQARTFTTLFRKTSTGQVRGIAGQYDKSVEDIVNSLLQVDPLYRPSASRLLQDLKVSFKNCSRPPRAGPHSYPGRELVPQRTMTSDRVPLMDLSQGVQRSLAGNCGHLYDSEQAGSGRKSESRMSCRAPEDVVDGDAMRLLDLDIPGNDNIHAGVSPAQTVGFNHPGSTSLRKGNKCTTYHDTSKKPSTASQSTQCPSVHGSSRPHPPSGPPPPQPTDDTRAPRSTDQRATELESLCLAVLCLVIDNQCSRHSDTASSARPTSHRNTPSSTSRPSSGRTRTKSESAETPGVEPVLKVQGGKTQTTAAPGPTQSSHSQTRADKNSVHHSGRRYDVTPTTTSEAAVTSEEVQMINTFPGAFNVDRARPFNAIHARKTAKELEEPRRRSTDVGEEEEMRKRGVFSRQASEPTARGIREVTTPNAELCPEDESNWPTNLRQYQAIANDLLSKLSPEIFFNALNFARLFSREEVTMWLHEQAGPTGQKCVDDIMTLVQLNAQLDAETLQSVHHSLLHMGDPGHTSV